jgi:L-fuculose-phosphate aldolase
MTDVHDPAVTETRERVARLGRLLFDRHLTDACGGNMSARVGDLVCITPSAAGQKHQWQIDADDVLVTDLDGHILVGKGKVSRESNVHYGLHRHYGAYGSGVIHAHPRNLMVFVAMAQAMPPVLEANMKFGEVPCVECAPATTVELSRIIIAAFEGQGDRIRSHAAGVIAPWHGLFLMGKDIDAAFDAVERFDTNAYCYLMAQAAFGTRDMDMVSQRRLALEKSYARFRNQHRE